MVRYSLASSDYIRANDPLLPSYIFRKNHDLSLSLYGHCGHRIRFGIYFLMAYPWLLQDDNVTATYFACI
jgi:hypothetical protein